MKKLVGIIAIIIVAILIIFAIKEYHRTEVRSAYTNTYIVHHEDYRHHDSLGQTFVESAVRGAGTYTGYHVAKAIHHRLSGRHEYHRYHHSRY